MTVTDLDPPRTPLRLVSSSGLSAVRDHRYRAGAQLGREARTLLRDVLQSALRSGAPVDPDALRVVLAAKQVNHATPIRHFTANAIWQLMFVDVVAWCRGRRLELPPDAVHALRAIVEYLGTTATLAPGSDRLDTLHDAIDECTGGWPHDDPRHPVGAKRRRSVRSARGPKHS